MSNIEKIYNLTKEKKTVFLYDDFNEVVCKIYPIDSEIKTFVKFKGKDEYEIDSKAKLVLDIQFGGEFITEKEYNEF